MIVADLVKKLPAFFMEPDVSFPSSQEAAIGPDP
jgi:hypothetical protein